MIHLSCSDNPFRLQYEDDISKKMIFLGRVEEQLHSLLNDTMGIIVPPVGMGIWKGCDVNKILRLIIWHNKHYLKKHRCYAKTVKGKAAIDWRNAVHHLKSN